MICKKCNIDLSEDNFYQSKKSICKSCLKEVSKKSYRELSTDKKREYRYNFLQKNTNNYEDCNLKIKKPNVTKKDVNDRLKELAKRRCQNIALNNTNIQSDIPTTPEVEEVATIKEAIEPAVIIPTTQPEKIVDVADRKIYTTEEIEDWWVQEALRLGVSDNKKLNIPKYNYTKQE